MFEYVKEKYLCIKFIYVERLACKSDVASVQSLSFGGLKLWFMVRFYFKPGKLKNRQMTSRSRCLNVDKHL